MSLQIESLCDSRRIKIEGDLVDELARLPRSLAGMYSLILENIGQIEQRGRTVAKTMFKWLLCTNDATSQVTIAACLRAVSNEYRCLSIPDILDVCSTLVVFDEALDRFRFAHLSVREFFESQPGYTPSEANKFVLERLFPTMICNEPSEDPFWSYAILYWISHYHRLEEQPRMIVFKLHAKGFLFNGHEVSDIFNAWATEAHRLKHSLLGPESIHPPSESVHSLSESVHSPAQEGWIPSNQPNNLYTFEEKFRSPIELASRFGWLEILDHFKTNKSPDDFQDPAMKMMTVAIRFGQLSVVNWLLSRHVRPTNEQLHSAFKYRHQEIIRTFYDGNTIFVDALIDGQLPLILALCNHLEDVVQGLIEKGVNVNYRDRAGRTPLSYAVSQRSPTNTVERLIQAGADLGAEDHTGGTPLSLSIWGRHQPRPHTSPTNQVLNPTTLRYKTDVLQRVLQSFDCHTPCLLLHYGLGSMLENVDMRAEWTEILTYIATYPFLQDNTLASVARQSAKLVEDPEDPTQLAGQTLLGLAALLRHEKAVRVLLDWGIDPTYPAICRVRKRVSTVAQMGKSVSRQEPLDPKRESNHYMMSDELRQGPLAWAAYIGDLPLVQSILDRGLGPNIQNRKGQTALYFAVQQTEEKYSRIGLETDKQEIVRLLLQKGALVASADAYGGATVVAHAFKARYSKVAKVLLENGAGIPKGAVAGPPEQLWNAFNQGQDGIRQALLERIQGAQLRSIHRQSSSSNFCWSVDPLSTAARLIWGGTMRVLGDVPLTAYGEVDKAT